MAKQKPINPHPVGEFFTVKDIEFEIKASREYMQQDIPAEVILYQINYKKTDNDDIYGETHATEKVTLPPVKLNVKLNIEDSETVFLGESGLSKEVAGNLNFTIFNDELTEKKVDIKRGDYVGFTDTNDVTRYYEVIKNNRINNSNKKSLGGIKSFYREINCTYVQSDVFSG